MLSDCLQVEVIQASFTLAEKLVHILCTNFFFKYVHNLLTCETYVDQFSFLQLEKKTQANVNKPNFSTSAEGSY